MYPYNGRPTEEFLRDYNLKLRELQELIESQGMNLQLKPGGRCVVVPATSKNTEATDKNHLISYSQQYNANTIDSEDKETTETVYETYEDYQEFERKLTLIHEAKENGVASIPPFFKIRFFESTVYDEIDLIHSFFMSLLTLPSCHIKC